MPLFTRDDRSVLYVHVPKTGGTSIEHFFARNGFAAGLLDTGRKGSLNRYLHCPPQHMHAAQLQAVLRPQRCDFVFITVREPLARLVSEYRMRAANKPQPMPLSAWLDYQLKRYAQDKFILENHLRPQVEFMLPDCEVFRLEDGFETLAGRIEEKLELRLDRRRVGRPGNPDRVDVPPDEVDRIRDRVGDMYADDYAMFGYSPFKKEGLPGHHPTNWVHPSDKDAR